MTRAVGTFAVVNRLGLHARAAAKLVRVASAYPCEVLVGRDDQVVDAKSIMGVLLLCGQPGTIVTVICEGERAGEALAELGALFASGFGEGAA